MMAVLMRRGIARTGRPAIALVTLVVCGLASSVRGQDVRQLDRDTLENGNRTLPLIWNAYRQAEVAPVNLRNGPELARRLASGSLRLSQREFLQLVAENNLDLLRARYNTAIAAVDILRAKSGQAARGAPSAPLPAGVFAGALGAGVSTTAPLSAGGTGGAAISTQGRLVSFGPRGVFDPTVNVNVSYDRLVNPLNTTRVAGVKAVTVPSTVLQTRIQQELPAGTSYSVSFNLQRQASNQAGLLFNPALSSFGSVQVYQPLLNGFGRPLTQRFVTLARNNALLVSAAFRSSLNDTLSSAAAAYWDLVALRERQQAAAEAVIASEEQHNEDRQRVDLGVMSELDATLSESQLAAARVLQLQAETAVAQQEVMLKDLISRQDDPALDPIELVPADAAPGPAAITLPTDAGDLSRALERRSSIRQAELSVKNQRVAREFTRKNLQPVLSVFLQANIYALSKGTPAAIRQLVRLDYPEYSVGVTWSLPVFNHAAGADYLRTQLETEQTEASLQRTREQVTMQVRTATVGISQTRAAAEAADRALSASRTAYEGELTRLQFGVSTPYRVTLALRDLTAARSADAQARANLGKALVAYQAAVGTLLDENGIDGDAAERGDLWSTRR
jgi:outer membrane protein TolC